MNKRINIETAQFMDGSVRKTYHVTCSTCGKSVFINTITKSPIDYDYFCTRCGTFIENELIDEIIKDMQQEYLLRPL